MSEVGVNKVILIGRSGGGTELKFTQSGRPVANFSLAVNEPFRNRKGELQDRVQWVRCVAWHKAAEIAGHYVIKGKQVYVEGRLQTRKYENKEGNARAITEVVISNFRLLGGGARSSSNNGHAGGKAARTEAPSGGHEIAGDGIPF